MDLLEGIASRTSALKLTSPGPTREHLEQIIRAGTRAPDHGRLRPWRFVVLEGAAREKLGDAMADILRAKQPQATAEQLDAERKKAMRAPTIIVVAAKVVPGKIPAIEQVGAVGAGVQNMFLTSHALGYGAMWKTGGAAYDANVKAMFGLAPEDHIVAFLYLGTTATPGPLVPAPLEHIVTWWS
jgi:nitroreductase